MQNNVGNDPNPISVDTDFSQQPPKIKERITGGGTQKTLPENTQEGNLQTQFKPRKKTEDRKAVHIEHQQKPERRHSLPTITSKPLSNGHKSTKRLSLGDTPNDKSGVLQKEVSTIGNDKESGVNPFAQSTVRGEQQLDAIPMEEVGSEPPSNVQKKETIKPPVWQKIGEGLKFAGKAIGVVALGALAIALLPLTIAGFVISEKAEKKANDIKGTPRFKPEDNDSLPNKKKEYTRIIQLQNPSEEQSYKLFALKKGIQEIEKKARPWEILAKVGNVMAFPCIGLGAIL